MPPSPRGEGFKTPASRYNRPMLRKCPRLCGERRQYAKNVRRCRKMLRCRRTLLSIDCLILPGGASPSPTESSDVFPPHTRFRRAEVSGRSRHRPLRFTVLPALTRRAFLPPRKAPLSLLRGRVPPRALRRPTWRSSSRGARWCCPRAPSGAPSAAWA